MTKLKEGEAKRKRMKDERSEGRKEGEKEDSEENKAGYTAQDAPCSRTFHLQK